MLVQRHSSVRLCAIWRFPAGPASRGPLFDFIVPQNSCEYKCKDRPAIEGRSPICSRSCRVRLPNLSLVFVWSFALAHIRRVHGHCRFFCCLPTVASPYVLPESMAFLPAPRQGSGEAYGFEPYLGTISGHFTRARLYANASRVQIERSGF